MAAFQTTVEGSVKILSISGRLDLQSGADFRDTLRFLTEDDESTGRAAGRLFTQRRGQTRVRAGLLRYGLSHFWHTAGSSGVFRGTKARSLSRQTACDLPGE